jgi:hypothetical protein
MTVLITANATWHAPATLAVEQSQRIGLEIGQSDLLTSRIKELLPNTEQTPAGSVTVGPLVKARLIAHPNDADVMPSESADASTPSDITLLWTWIVRPKRPTDSLLLTAHIEVPIAGTSNVFPTDVSLQIPVRRTFSYTVGQIFRNWATWTGIVAAIAGGAAWLRRRMKRNNQQSQALGSPNSAQASPAVGSVTSTHPGSQPTSQGGGTTTVDTQPP